MKLSLGLTPRDYSVAGGAVTYDTDAQAYFTANTVITSSADKTAINDFYLGLKSDGIYTKLKAMYLPIWGSASTSKWNLINPLDTDAAYRATFATGFTYSSTGITGNGTSAYIDTYLTPSTTTGISINSESMGFYCRTNRAGSTAYAMGGNAGTDVTYIRLRSATDQASFAINNASNLLSGTTNTQGFYQVSKNATTTLFRGINTYSSVSASATSILTNKIFVFARNNAGTAAGYDNVESSFIYIGSGLTLAEMDNFKTRVNTLMTYFGLNV